VRPARLPLQQNGNHWPLGETRGEDISWYLQEKQLEKQAVSIWISLEASDLSQLFSLQGLRCRLQNNGIPGRSEKITSILILVAFASRRAWQQSEFRNQEPGARPPSIGDRIRDRI
jgi:hypothetical protein